MEWRFKQLDRNDTKVNPSHLEFFRSSALDDTVSALVREDIQNRLDAKRRGLSGPVKVRYFLSQGSEAMSAKDSEEWLKGLGEHLNSRKTKEELGVSEPFCLQQNMPYLAIECFNTTGLKGNPLATKDPDDSDDRNDFYWFIRNVGRTGKKAGDRGRWGLGKIVYPAASSIRSFFCYSVRESDFRPALIGRSVLAIHAVGDEEYDSEGYFARFDDEQYAYYATPDENADTINRFVKKFKLVRRPDEPGVSLVIPFPEESITYQNLVQRVIRSYFWEVLRGTMEVEVVQGDQQTTISAHTINDVVMSWAGLDEKERNITQRRLEFCRKSDRMRLTQDECYFELSIPRSYGSPKMQELFENEAAYQKARECYRAGRIVALELGVLVKKIKAPEAEKGSFLVYLQKDDELDRPDETFIRDGLTIIGESYIREAGVRALVLAEHEPLNEFLGDAENPAHTQWLSTTKHFHGKYSPGKTLLDYIQLAAVRLTNVLGKVEDELLEDLLDDIFGIPTDHNSKAQDKNPSKKRGRKKSGIIKPKPRSRYLETHALKNGFKVSRAGDATGMPDRVVVQMAYEAEGEGNPFSEYHPADFNLTDSNGDIVVEVKGCRELRREPNLIEVVVEEENFSVSVVGFDSNRDLRIDAKPYVDKSGGEDEQ